MSTFRACAVLATTVVIACGERALPRVDTDTSTTSTDPTTTASTNSASLTSTSAADSSSSGGSSSSTGGPSEFEMCGDNYPAEDCDVDWAVRNRQPCNGWVDDCGPKAACRFLDGYNTQCVALVAEPRGAYESCASSAECDKGLQCVGYCIPVCSCRPERPHCADPSLTCEYDGTAAGRCAVRCDLLDPVCPEPLFSCYPWSVPTCSSSSVSLTLPLGASCELQATNEYCSPGLFCTDGGAQCLTAHCCSPFCSLADPNACADLGAEFACQIIDRLLGYDGPCYESIGVCRPS